MAPKLQLLYFNARGRAEIIRLLLAQAGASYEDKRVEFGEWPSVKPTTPLGQMPVLTMDGLPIPQTMAILRILAREFGMFGATSMETTKIEVLMESINDMFECIVKAKFANGDDAKAAALKALDDKLASVMKYVESVKKQASDCEWLVSKRISIADIMLFNVFEVLSSSFEYKPALDLLDRHPLSKNIVEKVAKLPNIKAYVAKRPKADF